ncbi:hypothetical protein SMD20_27345 [Nonomuraea sp. LP-02]|uniref:hypothetical protein n=1 Tax=Nonomuraea sp. LP-02 TaxID=3097960 RepID=UPI002E3732AA|nr:hypothetical protein [Nonomuraea sp. LP-02]MED7928004.1 hypothetical protein [Nonomuraea sp. LP-02]
MEVVRRCSSLRTQQRAPGRGRRPLPAINLLLSHGGTGTCAHRIACGDSIRETPEIIGLAGLIAIVLGVLLAIVQANTTSSSSPLWVTIFIGIALMGVGLRIEAAIRDRSRR